MLDMIHSGKIRIDINPEKQNRHCKIIDFLKKVNRKPLKIIICFQATLLYLIELNKLLMEKSNTGIMLLVNNKFNKKKL